MQKPTRTRIVKSPKQFLGILLGTVLLRKALEKYKLHTIRMDMPSTGLERYEIRRSKLEERKRREQSQFIRVSQTEETS